MKIAIVGAGWVGCHLSNKLKNKHEIHLYDEKGIFAGTSFKNQNRLHLGYHYARNFNTRKLCLDTYARFLSDYKKVASDVKKNVYSIPCRESLLDFKTYLSIFNKKQFSYQQTNVPELKGIDGSILVAEKYINPWKAKNYFQKKLNGIFVKKSFSNKDLKEAIENFDLVINCTNNFFYPIKEEYFYEKCIVLKYKKIKKTSFDALTLVDGKLFSIYPYEKDIFTVTSVEHTPWKLCCDEKELFKDKKISKIELRKIIKKFEDVIHVHFPDFNDYFVFDGFFVSTKAKNRNESSNRNPIISVEDNLICCYTGKIQGIYCIEDFIKLRINK